MSAGLYTKAHVARWMGKRPQDIQALIDRDGLPAIPVPSETRQDDRIPLHGLHRWCSARAKGSKFMTVDELALEMEMCAETEPTRQRAADLAALMEISGLITAYGQTLSQGLPPPARIREALLDSMRAWTSAAAPHSEAA